MPLNQSTNAKTLKCFDCERPNPIQATRCMWCTVPIVNQDTPESFALTKFELHYLGGIARLDNPEPVSLTVSLNGIEVKESLPGSRCVQIAPDEIIEAHIINNIQKVKVESKVSWWRKLVLDDEALEKHKRIEQILYDYIITIRFHAGEKTCSAAFQSEGKAGASVVHKVAKTINSLLRFKAIQSN
jgi:hypothetical protein